MCKIIKFEKLYCNLYVIYYFVTKNVNRSNSYNRLVYISFILIILFSALWVPLTYLGLKNHKYKIFSILCLVLVSIGSLILLISTIKDVKNKDIYWKVCIGCLSIFAFHVTIVDLISWSPLYLK